MAWRNRALAWVGRVACCVLRVACCVLRAAEERMASRTGLKENATRVEESRFKAGDKSYYYFNVPSGEEAAPKARQAVVAHTTAHRPAFSVGMHRRNYPSAFTGQPSPPIAE